MALECHANLLDGGQCPCDEFVGNRWRAHVCINCMHPKSGHGAPAIDVPPAVAIRDGDWTAFNASADQIRASPNDIDPDSGSTLLGLAILHGRDGMAEVLRGAGARLSRSSPSDLRLLALRIADIESLERDFDERLVLSDFTQALWHCMHEFDEHTEGLDFLVNHCGPGILGILDPSTDRTTLEHAVCTANPRMLQCLLEHLEQHGVRVPTTSLLLKAVFSRLGAAADTVRLLVKHNRDPLTTLYRLPEPSTERLPILSVAVGRVKSSQSPREQAFRLDMVAVLLEPGVGADIDLLSSQGRSPILVALQESTPECVALLLRHGATVDPAIVGFLTEVQREVLMLLAITSSRLELVVPLAHAGAPVDFALGGDGCTPLTVAAAHGHIGLVRDLLRLGASPALLDGEGNTALALACEAGHHEVVCELLREPVCVDRPARHNHTPIMLAAMHGHGKIVYELRKYCDVDRTQPRTDKTALMLAVQHGRTHVVASLLSEARHGDAVLPAADAAMRDTDGLTAMHLACMSGNPGVVARLCASVSLPVLQMKDPDGRGPVRLAVEREDEEVLQILLRRGVDIDELDNNGGSALMAAATGRSVSIMRMLIDAGADPSLSNAHGSTALHMAATAFNRDAAVLLVTHPQVDINAQSRRGSTALHRAARRGAVPVVRVLLKHNADVSVQNHSRQTAADIASTPNLARLIRSNPVRKSLATYFSLPMRVDAPPDDLSKTWWGWLWLAVSHEDEEVLQALLQRGIDPNEPNAKGVSALMVAATGRSISIMRMLIDGGADPSLVTARGITALHLAAENRNRDAAALLAAHPQVDVNAQDWRGDAALHRAARRGAVPVVRVLLKHNADVSVQNSLQETAADVASTPYLARLIRSNPVRKSLAAFLLPIRFPAAPANTPIERFARHAHFDFNVVSSGIIHLLTGQSVYKCQN